MARRRWHPETLTCAVRGHFTPAAGAARRGPDDPAIGVELEDGRRFSRCLRCDHWMLGSAPEKPEYDTVPDFTPDELPRRGKALRDAIVLRIIAIDRGIHAVVFALLAVGLFILDVKLPVLQEEARHLVDHSTGALADTGQDPSRTFLSRQLDRVLNLHNSTLKLLIAT